MEAFLYAGAVVAALLAITAVVVVLREIHRAISDDE